MWHQRGVGPPFRFEVGKVAETQRWFSFPVSFNLSTAGAGSLFAITGRMNCGISLAGRKI